MRFILLSLLFLVSQFLLPAGAMANDEFPGRAKFPTIKVYELADLKRDLDNVVVVDARSAYEFETLRIKGAVNIPINSSGFVDELQKIRKDSQKPIVFYCNGRTCLKSYKAAVKAGQYGISNVYSYDAGIFEWASAYPDNAELLGQSPVDKSRLIAKQDFKKRLLAPVAFADRVYAPGTKVLVLDVRDSNQRGSSIGFFPGKERWVSLDDKKKLEKYLAKAKKSNKTLFIYDEVGKQVRWLQYALEKHGIKDYFFMDKGARAYYAAMSNW